VTSATSECCQAADSTVVQCYGYAQIVYKLADLGFAKDQSEAAACQTKLGTIFYIVRCFISLGVNSDLFLF